MSSPDFNTYSHQPYPQGYQAFESFAAPTFPTKGINTGTASQYPQHYKPTAKESFPPSPEAPLNNAKRFAQQCTEAARSAEQLAHLEEVNKGVQKNLKDLGAKLNQFGAEPIKFTPKFVEPIIINSHDLNDAKKTLADRKKEIEKDIKDGIRAEFRAEKTIEEEVHVERKFNRAVNGTQPPQTRSPNGNFAHSQTHAHKPYHQRHQPYHHNYTGKSHRKTMAITPDVAATAIVVAAVGVVILPSFVATAVAVGAGIFMLSHLKV